MTSGGCNQKARLDQRSRETRVKYEQHAGRERVVRLMKNILADPRVTADDNVQTEQSTDADFNKLVCNSNGPYRAKRMR